MIPKIDQDIGIFVYSTNFPGRGGKIKIHNEDFAVSEVLSKKSINSITQNDGYAVFKLKKHGIDTHHALNSIFKKHGLRLKALGLKDASAVTEQFVCSTSKSNLSISSLSESKFSLEKIGFVKKPLTKKDMVGNKFTIKITGATSNMSKFNEYEKILNFYGYQRFGSKRPVTHLIGKSLLRKDFKKATDLLLSFTSEHDQSENNKIRKQLQDKSNFVNLIDMIPQQMDLERIVVNRLIEHDDYVKAIRALPLSIRRFFIQAYQSYIFNKTISQAFDAEEELFAAKTGDVCYDKNSTLGKFENDPQQRLAIPVVGYSYYKKTRFHSYVEKILEEEEVSPSDFFIKEMQEISNEGGFRNSTIKCDEFTVSDDTVTFTLSRGSYATIVLREIMKPNDPLIAGF